MWVRCSGRGASNLLGQPARQSALSGAGESGRGEGHETLVSVVLLKKVQGLQDPHLLGVRKLKKGPDHISILRGPHHRRPKHSLRGGALLTPFDTFKSAGSVTIAAIFHRGATGQVKLAVEILLTNEAVGFPSEHAWTEPYGELRWPFANAKLKPVVSRLPRPSLFGMNCPRHDTEAVIDLFNALRVLVAEQSKSCPVAQDVKYGVLVMPPVWGVVRKDHVDAVRSI